MLLRRCLVWLNGNVVIMTILVSLFLLGLMLIVNRMPLWHTDIWAHLEFGSWIAQHRSFPEREPFLPTASQEPYIPFAWLSQVSMWLIYQASAKLPFRWSFFDEAQPGGVDTLRFAHGLLVAARFLFLYLAFLRCSKSMLVSCLGIVVSLALCWNNLDVLRPQVWGELCFAIMLFLVCRQPPGRAGTWLVPLLMVFWANLHGSYLNGLLVLFGVLFSRMVLAIKESTTGGGSALHAPAVRRTFRMFYLSILAIGILNPLFSFRWYSETLAFTANANVRTMDEWQALHWSSYQGIAFSASLGMIVITQLLARWRRVTGISLGHGLLMVCFGLQVIFFQRMMPWWAMLCPLVCMGPWSRLLNAPEQQARVKWSRFMQVVVILAVCWIGLAWSTLGQVFIQESITELENSLHPGTPRAMAWTGLKRLPQNASPSLVRLAAEVKRPGATIFCSETLGDYLLFSDFRTILIYSHVQLFSVEHWQKYLQVKRGEPGWEEHLNRWNARCVCVEAELHPLLCQQIRRSANWVVVLDEAGSNSKPNPVSRLFIAMRK